MLNTVLQGWKGVHQLIYKRAVWSVSQQQKDLHPKEWEVNENQKKSKLFKL